MDLPTADGFPYKDGERSKDQTLAGAIAELNELPDYEWKTLSKLQKYWYYIATEGIGSMKIVDDLPMDPAEIKPKSLYNLTKDVEHGGIPYEKGLYYYDTKSGTWIPIGKTPETGPIFLGNVDHTTTSLPTTRPSGAALVNGDYIKVDPEETDFPFTIGDLTFNNPKDQAAWLGSKWVPNANAFQKTDETPVTDASGESFSGTATMQSDINIENVEQLKNLIIEAEDLDEIPTDKIYKRLYRQTTDTATRVAGIYVYDFDSTETDKWNKIAGDIQAGNTLPSGKYEGELFILLEDVIEGSSKTKKGIYRFNGSLWQHIAYTDPDYIPQLEELPDPGLNHDEIVQYVGETTDYYTNGYFYKSVLDGADYVWKQWNIQPGDNYDFLSLERLGDYIYQVTFDSLPEYKPLIPVTTGGCSSFVKDGKLYRNFDWGYDETAEFRVITKGFEGMAMIPGLEDGSLDYDKVAQAAYHVNDGVNRDGIMVSSHVLYNDWSYAGAGDKDKEIILLPYFILTNLHSMDDITTVLADYLANIKINDTLVAKEYLMQFVVTDGTTTYAILPPESATGSYVLQNITSTPKLANFRWVSDTTVDRADLQNRPNGVERWNEISDTTTLADLRFTKAYEAPTRLSEFIGEAGTTKDSTDAELEAIYDIAHDKYLTRTRDGELWQTVHAVVYSVNGMEHLFAQENFEKDYIASSQEIETMATEQITVTDPTVESFEGTSSTQAGVNEEVVNNLKNAIINYSDLDTVPSDKLYRRVYRQTADTSIRAAGLYWYDFESTGSNKWRPIASANLIKASSNQTVRGESIPRLTEDQIRTVYNAQIKGQSTIVLDKDGINAFTPIQAYTNDDDEILVRFIYDTYFYFAYKITEDGVEIDSTGVVTGNKLDKNTNRTLHDQAYVKTADAETAMVDIDYEASANAIIRRNETGNAEVADPTEPEHIANKDYVDSRYSIRDVVDVYNYGTDTSKTDIVHYDYGKLADGDKVIVVSDEMHDGSTTVFEWGAAAGAFAFKYNLAHAVIVDVTGTLPSDPPAGGAIYHLTDSSGAEVDGYYYFGSDLRWHFICSDNQVAVRDVVQFYDRGADSSKTDIVHYDTSKLLDGDKIVVVSDVMHDNSSTVYQFDKADNALEYKYTLTDEGRIIEATGSLPTIGVKNGIVYHLINAVEASPYLTDGYYYHTTSGWHLITHDPYWIKAVEDRVIDGYTVPIISDADAKKLLRVSLAETSPCYIMYRNTAASIFPTIIGTNTGKSIQAELAPGVWVSYDWDDSEGEIGTIRIIKVSHPQAVRDVVKVYNRGTDTSKTDVVHYGRENLTDGDVLKALSDETHDNLPAFYRYDSADDSFDFVALDDHLKVVTLTGSTFDDIPPEDLALLQSDETVLVKYDNVYYHYTDIVDGSLIYRSITENTSETSIVLNKIRVNPGDSTYAVYSKTFDKEIWEFDLDDGTSFNKTVYTLED